MIGALIVSFYNGVIGQAVFDVAVGRSQLGSRSDSFFNHNLLRFLKPFRKRLNPNTRFNRLFAIFHSLLMPRHRPGI